MTEWRRMLLVANSASNNIEFGGSFGRGGSYDYDYYYHCVYEVWDSGSQLQRKD